ncbi:MAG: hypothetical protein GY938_30995 [Ketobacter sp.]|nr:hypothetical protein [Ketobacter sp.]
MNQVSVIGAPALIRAKDPGFTKPKLVGGASLTFSEDAVLERANANLRMEVLRTLHKYYLGQPWMAEADIRQGFVDIRMVEFSNYCYVLHIKNMLSPNAFDNRVKKAGGEMLECFKQPREAFDLAYYQEALKNAPLRGQGPKPA